MTTDWWYHRAVKQAPRQTDDFVYAVLVAFAILWLFGALSLVLRPIPSDIYPTFAFRAEDGLLRIAAFLTVNMASASVLVATVIAACVATARRGRPRAAAVGAGLVQTLLLAGTFVGGTGTVGDYRALVAVGLVAGSVVGMLVLSEVWRRISQQRRPVLVASLLAAVLAADAMILTALGHFAKLYGSLIVWLGVWTIALCFAMLRLVVADRRPPTAAGLLAVAIVMFGAVDLIPRVSGSFLHVRRVFDWRCPEAATFVNLQRTAQLDVYKLRGVLRTKATGASFDEKMLAAIPEPAKKYHVIFFVGDALRRDRVQPFSQEVSTPSLAALAAESTVFTSAYSPSPTTGYSLVSIFSGVLPEAAVAADGPPLFLPYALRHHGWGTGTCASFDGLHDMVPVLSGFDTDDVGFTEVTHSDVATMDPRFDSLATDALIERLKQSGDAPRFEYVHLYRAHGPFLPPDSVAKYDQAVRSVDAELGRLIEALRDAELWDRTILAVMGDHGEGLGEHGTYAHSQSLYVEQTAVPLILRIPGQPPATIEHPLTLNHLPTLVMDALGSRWPIDTQPDFPTGTPNRDFAIQEFHIRSELVWRAIRTSRWSYHHRILDGTTELYNLAEDRGEARDVSSEFPEVVSELRAVDEAL